MSSTMIAIGIGYILDLIFGDPIWLWHPVILIGKVIAFTEKTIRRLIPISSEEPIESKGPKEKEIGILLVIVVCLVTVGSSFLILWIAYRIHPFLKIGIESIMCYQILATKSLKTESMKVYQRLKDRDIEGGREQLSMIVGRDTNRLDEKGMIKATVETIAENTSDGVIAPLFYMMFFGAVGGFLYKAINTMDSMVGYKNETYRFVGWAAARLDDAANFIPSRVSAILMIASAWILRMDWKKAITIFHRDRFCHASPNSAQTEAVCAGALRIQLAGDAYYFGILYPKKTIGDDLREPEMEDIRRTNRLLYVTSMLGVIIVLLVGVCLRSIV